MTKRLSILAVLAILALAGFTAGAVSPAKATTMLMQTIGIKSGNPAPTCPSPYVFSGKKAGCVPCPQGSQYNATTKTCKAVPVTAQKCAISTDANGVKTTVCVNGVQASADDIDTGRVTILGYIQAKGMAKAVVKKLTAQGKCFWVGRGTKHPVFTNSGARTGSGAYGKFKDTRRTFVCRTGKGPSGIQKVFDINPRTGEREHYCDNYIWVGLVKGLIKGTVEVVRNLANVHMHLHAEAHVVAVSPNCPGAYAEGSGQADITLSLNEYMRTRGSATSHLSASAYGKATAHAKASITCTPTQTVTTQSPPPPTVTQPSTTTVHTTTTVPTTTVVTTTTTTTTTPVTHTVQVSCTGFEEISGDSSMLIKCDASDDNGAQISLHAHSNDSNSYVSGINCYSQGGAPSCNGNGQFEFRVNGVNTGSAVLMSSVSVTATANGVRDSHTYTFKVDPSGGGFGG